MKTTLGEIIKIVKNHHVSAYINQYWIDAHINKIQKNNKIVAFCKIRSHCNNNNLDSTNKSFENADQNSLMVKNNSHISLMMYSI